VNWPGVRTSQSADRRLGWAIAISLAVHVLLLALHFEFPEVSRVMRDKALDIVLVNSRSASRPSDAQVLAQANLDGGGNVEAPRVAKTPLPATRQQVSGSDVQQMQRRVQALEAAQRRLLAQAKSAQRVNAGDVRQPQPKPSTELSGRDLAETARAMARLEGEISKSMDEYNKRPRKKFVGARAQEYALAAYLDAWKQKIERIGTLNYPEEARGKLYGSVVLFVELKADDGSIYNVEVSRSSGHKLLDQAAIRILRLAAPFGPVPPQGLGGASVLSFARTWHFTQGDAFNTAH